MDIVWELKITFCKKEDSSLGLGGRIGVADWGLSQKSE